MALKVGDTLPSVEVKDENDAVVKLGPSHMTGPMVLYFYPKDDTPGCTKEACSFRDSYASFTDAGVTVYGVSGDSPKSHRKFIEKYQLPFSLLSDKGNTLRKAIGVPTNLLGLIPGRVTYIIDKHGKIVHIFNSQTQAEKHVTEALHIIKTLG
ncbi:MAG: peroxiredoxin [Flavobacteriales bacterium]|nr:peroxiredoxin [Flavobacteriales bacterium]